MSFLGEEQEAVSSVFAKRGDPEQGSLRGVPFHDGPHGTPLLDGAIAYLECRVSDVLPGGDHDLFVGEALGRRDRARRRGAAVVLQRPVPQDRRVAAPTPYPSRHSGLRLSRNAPIPSSASRAIMFSVMTRLV